MQSSSILKLHPDFWKVFWDVDLSHSFLSGFIFLESTVCTLARGWRHWHTSGEWKVHLYHCIEYKLVCNHDLVPTWYTPWSHKCQFPPHWNAYHVLVGNEHEIHLLKRGWTCPSTTRYTLWPWMYPDAFSLCHASVSCFFALLRKLMKQWDVACSSLW